MPSLGSSSRRPTSPTLPSQADPCQPRLAGPCLASLAQPDHAGTCHDCPAKPCHDKPCLALPSAPSGQEPGQFQYGDRQRFRQIRAYTLALAQGTRPSPRRNVTAERSLTELAPYPRTACRPYELALTSSPRPCELPLRTCSSQSSGRLRPARLRNAARLRPRQPLRTTMALSPAHDARWRTPRAAGRWRS